ncbi:hypothetical protein AB1L07_01840 [Niallia alba]|uniref:homing endonuclease associated repeat-containing protein n=1 Tax=Niallia alba TaxID=2729105 RepID=UPI00399F3D96
MSKIKYTEEKLIAELKRYYIETGELPTVSKISEKGNGFPDRKIYQKHFITFGNALVKAGFEYRGLSESETGKKRLSPKNREIKYNQNDIKKFILNYVKENNLIPTLTEIELLPNAPIRSEIRKHYGNYNNLLKELNLHPKFRRYTDEELGLFLNDYILKNGKIPAKNDFLYSPNYPSVEPYINRFGTWNKALLYFNIHPTHKYIDIEKMKLDLIKLCNEINSNEGRKLISCSDIEDCSYCMSLSSYRNNFKDILNITLREFIESIGFELVQSGMGLTRKFDNGEITQSKWESIITDYLRGKELKYNEDYFRSVRYDSFVKDYYGNKDCDYLIVHNDNRYYVEIVGMIDNEKGRKDSFIEKDYLRRLKNKEDMLKTSNVNYLIVYPHDIRNKSLDEIFSFLHN